MVISLIPASGVKCQVGEFSVLVDASSSRKGDLILKTTSKQPFEAFSPVSLIEGPGEYEVSGVRVRGVELLEKSSQGSIRTAYALDFDGIRLGFLGKLGSIPSDEALDALGEIDILFLSADIKNTKGKELVSLVKQITPSIVIPTDSEAAKLISEEIGQRTKPLDKLVIKKSDIQKQETANKLVWLKI